jgi:hypothetical protein
MAIRVINTYKASAAHCGRTLASVLIEPLLEGVGRDGVLSDAVDDEEYRGADVEEDESADVEVDVEFPTHCCQGDTEECHRLRLPKCSS